MENLSRIKNSVLIEKIISADTAAACIQTGMLAASGGLTKSGDNKAVLRRQLHHFF